jgi:glycosyltransferase involved in cell wall biosynthesis
VPNGAAAPTLETCMENRIGEPGSRDSTVKCLFVGRLSVYQKGLDILLRAFAEAARHLNGQALSLTLIGPDWDGGMARLMQLSKQLGIDDLVSFTGTLPNEKIAAALKTFDIYIQLSRYEGFSLSIAEALLAGKPAILSRNTGTGSYPEIGSLPHIRLVGLDPREAAQAILEFAGRLSGVKQDAERHRAGLRDFFSWERIARLHLETYEALGPANK